MKKKYYELKQGHGWFGGYIKETDVISCVDSGMWKWHILIVEKLAETNKIIERERVEQVRIRKLTPRECYRLMGFSDEDFDKAKEVNSDSQLYKQAGNSIVVNVLMEIFKEML